MPTANGCAVFLGDASKTFVIYVDHSVGKAIQMTLNGIKQDRPLTHDLIGSLLLGLGVRLEHIVVNDQRDGQYVTLASGVDTDQVVRHLVGQGMAVFEIAREKQTLEDFYLSLMKKN